MGQQQLLLLVLSTVIVGLATVAGIQAFDEGRSQAAQDALQQRALSIAQEVKGAYETPSQLGGIGSSASAGKAAAAAGFTGAGSATATGDAAIPAQGAGDNAACVLQSAGTAAGTAVGNLEIHCQENEGGNDGDGASVTAQVGPNTDPQITDLNDTEIGT